MSLTFGQSDIIATLTPEKPRPGAKPMSVRAYARFGRIRERLVQEICDAVGGEAVYLEFRAPGGTTLMPVVSWKRPRFAGNGESGGYLVHAADALKIASDKGWTITAYGSARRRWTVAFSTVRGSAARDALDMEPDSQGAPRSVGLAAAAGEMREEF